MLAETDATTTPLPRNEVLNPQPGRAPARQDGETGRPLSREPAHPQETGERRIRQPSEPEQQPARGDDKPSRNRTSRALRASLAALLFASVAGGGYLYWDNASHYETTDDAFIAARQFAVAPKVAGYITAVPVTDNQHVASGAVIARIDDRDYRVALAQAEAQVAAAQASIGNIDAQIGVQQAQVAQTAAQVQQQQAGLTYAQQQSSRYGILAREGAGTTQDAQQWVSRQRQDEASLNAAQQTVVAAERQLPVLQAQRSTAEANLAQAEAQRDRAQLNLSDTTIVAAQPGRVVQLGAAVGQYAPVGTALTMFVPDDIWVDANFKEIQLDRIRPGQPVAVHVDAYPEQSIHGHVASIQPGSGTAFSLLPAENATGNYVKIVQRVPVKIVLDNPPAGVALGPGMSVEPSVRINAKPSILARLENVL
jgi:membrane fusion protein (multidrug efflux system)